MNLPLLVFAAVLGTLLLVAFPSAARAYRHFRHVRTVRCPTTGMKAVIRIDPWHAAVTAFPGPPRMHVEQCSLWPMHGHCGEACAASSEAR